ncbi:hypothetical protein V1506DRAFT_527096 [Lipomyces tetrasporus]
MPIDDFGEDEDYAFLMPSRLYISPPGSARSSSGKVTASSQSERSLETMSTTDDEDSYSVISNISNIDEEEFNDNISTFSSTGVRSAASSSSSEAEFGAANGHDEMPHFHDSLVHHDIADIADELSDPDLTNTNESIRDGDEHVGHVRSDIRYDTTALVEGDAAEPSMSTVSSPTILVNDTDVSRLQTLIVYCMCWVNDFLNWISFRYKLISPALILGIPNVIFFSNTDDSEVLAKVQPKLINSYKCAPSVLISPLTSSIWSWLERLGYVPRFISWVPIIRRCEYVSMEQGKRYIAIDTLFDGQKSKLYAAHGECVAGSRLNRRTCPDLIVVEYDPSGPHGITSRMLDNLRRVTSVVNVPVLILSDAKQLVHSDFDFLAERSSMARHLNRLSEACDSSIAISTSDLIEMDDNDIYNALISASRSVCRVGSNHSVAKNTPVCSNKSSVYEKTVWNRLILGAVIASLTLCLHIFCPSVPYGLQLQQTDFRFHVISKNSILIKSPTLLHRQSSFWTSAHYVSHDFNVDTVSRACGEVVPNAEILKVFGDEALITLNPRDAWGDINITLSSMAFKKWYIVNLGRQEYAHDYDVERDSMLKLFKAWTATKSVRIWAQSKELYLDYVKPAAKGASKCAGKGLRQLGDRISDHYSEYSNIAVWPALLKGYNASLILITENGNQGALFVRTKYDAAKEFSTQGFVELSQWWSDLATHSGERTTSLLAVVYTSWKNAKNSMEPTAVSVSGNLKRLNSKVYEKYVRYKNADFKSSVSSAVNAHRKLFQVIAKANNKFVEGFKFVEEDARNKHYQNTATASKNAKKVFDKYMKTLRKSLQV